MAGEPTRTQRIIGRISQSGLSIYDPIEVGDPNLWIPTAELETLLDLGLRGLSLAGLPLRTRSKFVKQHVCRSLGYPRPVSFKRTRPRFPGQDFDIYVQKSNNLQIWNEEIAPTRRYVVIRVSADDVIERVKVVAGTTLALLDTTGTLTQKYQARFILGKTGAELITPNDTTNLSLVGLNTRALSFSVSPVEYPVAEMLFPIGVLYARLRELVGRSFLDTGSDQERNRGAALHRLVCHQLGYKSYQDYGQCPDVLHQLLEVKLQTSPTIDLGLICPDSTDPLDVPRIRGHQIRHCDVRYAIFYALTDGNRVTLTHFYLTTGEAFFSRFPRFGGKVLNKKLQIPLPASFFVG